MTFEIDDYTDAELYDVLDLTNPTDRELEAKILMQIHKYNSFESESSEKLVKFFEDVYEHFFNVNEGTDEITRESDTAIVTDPVPASNDGVDDTFLSEAQLSSLRSKNSPFAKTEQQVTQPEQESSIGYTRPFEYSKGILNPLLKQTTTRVISIDSQYRPNKNTTASDFTFNLSEPLRDVVSLKLYSVQIPNTWYTIGKLFGSNFLIFKGRADGITDDAFDIKFEIDPGNYTPEQLASTVNASIDDIYNNELVIPDISGSRIEYNSNTSLNKMNVKVKDIYNESSYQLSFPYWTSPIPFVNTGDKTRNESIPEFLGFIERTYKFNTIKSRYDWRFEESESNFYNNELFSITELNKSFEVIKYSGTTEYEHNVSTVDLSFDVALTASSELLNRSAIRNLLDNALRLNDKLFIGDSTITLDPIDSGNDTIASASLYNMTVKLDRKTYNHASDSKLAIKFPEEDLYNVEYALNTEYDSVVDISQNIYGTLSTTTEILQSGSTKAYRIIMTSSQSLRELRVNPAEETAAITKEIYDSSNNLLTSIGNIGNIIASRQLNVNPSIDTHFTLFLKNTSNIGVNISLNGLTYVDYANNTNAGNSLIFQNNTSSTDVDDISFNIEPNNFLSAFMIRKHNSDNQSTDKIHYRITNETGLVISGDISNADVSSSIINFDTTLSENKTSILSGNYTLELSGNAANEIEYEIEIKQKDFAPDVFDISNILEILVAESKFDDNIIVFSLDAGDRLKNITIIKQDSTNSETIEYRLTSRDTETVHIDGSTTDVNTIITPQPVIKPTTDNTQYLLRLSTGSSAQVIHTVIIEKIPDYDKIGEYITFVDDELTVINTIYNSDQDIISFDISVGEYVPSLEVSDFSYNGDVDVSMEYVLFSIIDGQDISFASGYIDINNKTLPIAEDLSAGSYKLDLSSSNVVSSYPIDYKLSAVKRTIQDISLGISTIYERTGTIKAYNFDLYSLSVDVSDIIIEQTSENEIYWRLTDNSMIDLSGNSESSDTSFNILENETLTNTLPYKLYISVSGDVVEDVSYTVRALNTEIVLSDEPLLYYPIDHHTRVYDTITRDSGSQSATRTLFLSINPYTYVEQFILKELVRHTDYEANNTTLTITTNNETEYAASTIIDIVDTYGGNSSIYSGIINTSETVITNTRIQTEIQGYSSIDYYYDIVTKDIEPIFYDASNNLNVSGDLSAYTTRVVSFDLSANDVIRSLNTSPTTDISFSLYSANIKAITPYSANIKAITPLRPTIYTTYYLQITNNASTATSYDVSGIRLQDYTGTTTDISVTDVSFVNDIVTIENEITQVDFIDRIRFIVPEKRYVYELNTIDISNIDTADVSLNYRLTNSGETIDISGIITADDQSLLSDNLFLPSGTYTLQLEAPPSMINSTYYKLEGSQRSIQDTSFINDKLNIVTITPSIYEIILGNGYSLTGLSSAYRIIKGTDIRATPISVSDLSAGTYQLIVNTNTTITITGTRIFDYADLQDISFSNNLITFENKIEGTDIDGIRFQIDPDYFLASIAVTNLNINQQDKINYSLHLSSGITVSGSFDASGITLFDASINTLNDISYELILDASGNQNVSEYVIEINQRPIETKNIDIFNMLTLSGTIKNTIPNIFRITLSGDEITTMNASTDGEVNLKIYDGASSLVKDISFNSGGNIFDTPLSSLLTTTQYTIIVSTNSTTYVTYELSGNAPLYNGLVDNSYNASPITISYEVVYNEIKRVAFDIPNGSYSLGIDLSNIIVYKVTSGIEEIQNDSNGDIKINYTLTSRNETYINGAFRLNTNESTPTATKLFAGSYMLTLNAVDSTGNTTLPLWTGKQSCFKFDDISGYHELSRIGGEVRPVAQAGATTVENSPRIVFTCKTPGFIDSSNNFEIAIPNTTGDLTYEVDELITEINNTIVNSKDDIQTDKSIVIRVPVNYTYNEDYDILPSGTFAYKKNNKLHLQLDFDKTFDENNYEMDLSNSILYDFFQIKDTTVETNNQILVDFTKQYTAYIPKSNNELFVVNIPNAGFTICKLTAITGIQDVQTIVIDAEDVSAIKQDYKNDSDFRIVNNGVQIFRPEIMGQIMNDIFSGNKSYTYRDPTTNQPIFAGIEIIIRTDPLNSARVETKLKVKINKRITPINYQILLTDTGSNNGNLTQIWTEDLFQFSTKLTDLSGEDFNAHVDQVPLGSPTELLEEEDIAPYASIDSSSNITLIGIKNVPTENTIDITNNNNNNIINITAYESGVSTTTGENANDINLEITPGKYTRSTLIREINNRIQLYSGPLNLSGTEVVVEDYTEENGTIDSRVYFIGDIIRKYTAADYSLVFYDIDSFAECQPGVGVIGAKWNATLGWMLGFRLYTVYALNAFGVTDNDGNEPIIQLADEITIQVIGDTGVSTTLYKHAVLCIDDFNQNRLNDGIITNVPNETNFPLPSYASRSDFKCDPVTGEKVFTGVGLTEKQIYAAQEAANAQYQSNALGSSVSTKAYEQGISVTNIFGLIPLKVSNLKSGDVYVEFGGTLQNQERSYFGPVNVQRMNIKLYTDTGSLIDLNSANWSFSLLCEQLNRLEA